MKPLRLIDMDGRGHEWGLDRVPAVIGWGYCSRLHGEVKPSSGHTALQVLGENAMFHWWPFFRNLISIFPLSLEVDIGGEALNDSPSQWRQT